MSFQLSKRFRFEAAHFLPMAPEGHPCRRLHGHSYQVVVSLRGRVAGDSGWVLDYGEMSAQVKPVLERLDHNFLNAVPGLENPTSENLAAWIWDRLHPLLPGLHKISIHETCRTRCDYEGPGQE